MKLKVLSQAKEYVVIHKPSGFLTYSDSPEQRSISAKDHLERQLKRAVFPVHRIDKDTCGILTFALTPQAAKELTALFRTRVVKKQYTALVHGIPPQQGVCEEPLQKHKEKSMEPAVTNFSRLQSITVELEGEKREYALLKLEPKTGRYHQIRRHLRFLGHPIVGDPEYGNEWDNRAFAKKFNLKRTLLSASSLAFPDRAQEKMVRVATQPDADFQRILREFWK